MGPMLPVLFLLRRLQAYCSSQFSLLPGSQLSVLDALPQLLIESFRCQPPMHEFVYCVASTMIRYAQGSREIFQPEKFLDRTGNRTRRLRIGDPCLYRLGYLRPPPTLSAQLK